MTTRPVRRSEQSGEGSNERELRLDLSRAFLFLLNCPNDDGVRAGVSSWLAAVRLLDECCLLDEN